MCGWKWTSWGGAVKRQIQIYKTSKKSGNGKGRRDAASSARRRRRRAKQHFTKGRVIQTVARNKRNISVFRLQSHFVCSQDYTKSATQLQKHFFFQLISQNWSARSWTVKESIHMLPKYFFLRIRSGRFIIHGYWSNEMLFHAAICKSLSRTHKHTLCRGKKQTKTQQQAQIPLQSCGAPWLLLPWHTRVSATT